MAYSPTHETINVTVVAFFISLVILGGVGAGAFTAHENNIKSRKVAEECVKNGGTFRQGNQGEMTCDGIKK